MSKIKMNYHLFITQPRVGSNFLVDSMNSSPELINFGDVLFKWAIPYKAYKLFNPIKGNPDYFNNIDYFEWLYKKNRLVFYFCKAYELKVNLVGKKKYIGAGITFRGKKYRNIKTIGVKEHYTHSRTQEVLSKIIPRDNSYSVITLSRKNLLQQYVSTQHAFASKQWFSYENKHYISDCNKIIINIDELFNYFNNKQQELHQLSELLSKNKVNVLKLTYEDIFQNEESKVKTIESVFDFLGIDRGHISPSNQKKMLPKKLADKIENYQEVINALKKTKYEHFLDE